VIERRSRRSRWWSAGLRDGEPTVSFSPSNHQNAIASANFGIRLARFRVVCLRALLFHTAVLVHKTINVLN